VIYLKKLRQRKSYGDKRYVAREYLAKNRGAEKNLT
jgi:hypothetical protein